MALVSFRPRHLHRCITSSRMCYSTRLREANICLYQALCSRLPPSALAQTQSSSHSAVDTLSNLPPSPKPLLIHLMAACLSVSRPDVPSAITLDVAGVLGPNLMNSFFGFLEALITIFMFCSNSCLVSSVWWSSARSIVTVSRLLMRVIFWPHRLLDLGSS
jgi:hypothetical protein